MRRRLGIGILLAVAVGLLGLGLVGTVGAQTDPGTGTGPGLQGAPSPGRGPGPQGTPGQQGGPGPRGGPREGRGGAIGQTVADLLGMTPDQVRAERQAGKSLATIAAERGVDQATLVQAITNAMVGRIQGFVAQMVTREGTGPREGRGPQGGPAAGFPARVAMLQPVADLLGTTPDQIIAERRAGKSLADIAAERGVDQTTLVQAITVTAKARLDEQVAAGRLTQERADALYERIVQGAPRMVTMSGTPGFGPGGPGGRQGPGRGPGGQGPSGQGQ